MKYGIGFLLFAGVACSSGGDDAAPVALGPTIELERSGAGWRSRPVVDDLAENSNNGFGYTGEIDRYEILVPTTGRLQVVLQWTQDANLDLIVAEDPNGEARLAESNSNQLQHEFAKVDVRAGRSIWVFVAGWEGEPGAYELDTLLLPEEIPPFRAVVPPVDGDTLGRDGPLLIEFNEEIDPEIDVAATAFFVGAAEQLRGEWCRIGSRLIFFPELPDGSGIEKGLPREGVRYRLQFGTGFGALRSIHGEYLTELIDVDQYFENWNLSSLHDDFRLLEVEPADPNAWDGTEARLRFTMPLAPETIVASFRSGGVAYPAEWSLQQKMTCDGQADVVLTVRPATPLPDGREFTLTLGEGLRTLGGRHVLPVDTPSIRLRTP
ncbi:MAG: hypothetical protein AAGD14_03320 [Planctomycetota bacterium]